MARDRRGRRDPVEAADGRAGGDTRVCPCQRVGSTAPASRRDCVSRRHHYVPQSYLRAWSPDGRRVRVLDTRNGSERLQGLRDTCVRENFYRLAQGGEAHNQAEAMLAVIDDETARLLRTLHILLLSLSKAGSSDPAFVVSGRGRTTRAPLSSTVP
ncbi:DUF4238 domain-containing protein [Streptomyces sp. NPDC014793]|uniref:DUF4238 domain-containing protein n=1 Tax=Streptomyces sp. NPDC014793 TaxID=3364914 RepID=UPI0036FD1ACF